MVDFIEKIVHNYYKEAINTFGDTPLGVDWKNKESQDLRFKQIVKYFNLSEDFSVLDVGCGTGEFANYLSKITQNKFDYLGIDLVKEMIELSKIKFKSRSNLKFQKINLNGLGKTFDYVIASGIFNVKQDIKAEDWENYIFNTISSMFKHCNKVCIFNSLTSYVDFSIDKLYYCNPLDVFNFSKQNITKNIILDHSYPLYEWTMVLYKNQY